MDRVLTDVSWTDMHSYGACSRFTGTVNVPPLCIYSYPGSVLMSGCIRVWDVVALSCSGTPVFSENPLVLVIPDVLLVRMDFI